MVCSRRNFVKTASALALGSALPLGGCAIGGAMNSTPARRHVINGNMLIPQSSWEPFDDATKAQIRQSGLTAIKQSMAGSKGTYAQAVEMIEAFEPIFTANPDVFAKVTKGSDLAHAHDTQRVGVIYAFEAATMLEGNVDRIAEFAGMGVRSMQPGYNNTSPFGAGVMSTDGPLGLSALGHEAIAAMEDANVLVDLSHAHEETAFDVLAMATRPPVISHAGVDVINSHQRNKSDALLKALADKGGVMGLFEMSYLTPDLEQQSLEAFMAHIEHALNICGEDHVGIGSDSFMLGFDTGEENMAMWNALNKSRQESGVAAPGEGPPPYVEGINTPDKMPRIAMELSRRGHSAATVDKVMGNNFARVMKEAWPG